MRIVAALLFALLLLGQPLLISSVAAGPPASSDPPVVPPPATETAIQQAGLPWRDLQDLVMRVKAVTPENAYTAPQAPSGGRQVGEHVTFWVADEVNHGYFSVDATLRVVTPHAYMYVADDARVDQAKLDEAARVFEEKVYTVNRGYFGPEPAVGLDGDPHVSIVNASIPGLGGYFTSVDVYPRSVHHYSNERKAIYMSIASAPVASNEYYGILAHEFEHMIQWNTNREEESWIKEGSAEVATEAAGLRNNNSFVRSFENSADTQVNAWASEPASRIPHYGAAYLFISYFLEHHGGYEKAAELLTGNTRGPDSFDRFLASQGQKSTFEDAFRDWVVANYLDESGADDPRYRYDKLKVAVPSTEKVTATTGWRDRTVHQFAADYLELSGGWSSAKVRIQGESTTRVIAPPARSGSDFWWSNRGDMINTKLTHIFDLRKTPKATLNFWAWYDLEDGYDYSYVMASRDGGVTWAALKSSGTTTENPNGNNLGNGFTGRSGKPEPRWVEQTADLTPYAGQVVLIRFELVTDDAVNEPGFAVDDISVPELGYATDAESAGSWLPTGFLRTNGELSQLYSLQLISFGDQITVEQVPFPADGTEVEIRNPDGKLRKAVLVVSGLTRHTTEPAHYRYMVETGP